MLKINSGLMQSPRTEIYLLLSHEAVLHFCQACKEQESEEPHKPQPIKQKQLNVNINKIIVIVEA